MKIFKHTGRYYLKKIQKGYLTTHQVAEILNTTIDIVNSAYDDYCKEQTPLRKEILISRMQLSKLQFQ